MITALTLLRPNRPLFPSSASAPFNKRPSNRRQFAGQACHCTRAKVASSADFSQQQYQYERSTKDSEDATERLQSIQNALQKQQGHSTQATVSLKTARSLTETAMLAAVSGLTYTLATLLKLDTYIGYFLPLPVIIAAMRSGPAVARKTMSATCFLLLLLLGPLRTIAYFCMHGALALCLGTFWRWQVHWSLSVTAASIVRLVGQLVYFLITCWTTNENLYQLLLANLYSILDRVGGAGTSPVVVNCIIFALFAVNAITYICLTHLVYIPLLRGLGYQPTRLPQFVQKLVAQRQAQFELS